MKKTDKLTKKQVLAIPKYINSGKTIASLAVRYKVTENALYYWIKQLRMRGVEIKTRKRGAVGLLTK